jgi:hypothetical protein
MFGFTMPLNVEGLEAKAEAVANVLNEFKVFGNLEGLHLEVEKRGFKNEVTSHARDEGYSGYLELTYPSCVRLIITTHVLNNVAYFTDVEAYDHPRPNSRINYEVLNVEIQKTLMQER